MMKKTFKLISLILCLTMLFSSCAVHNSGTSDETTVEAAAQETEQRIVATSVVICQILDMLGIDSVVGVPKTDAYELPERYNPETHPEITVVGSPMGPNLELVKSLDPTIILSPMNLKGFLKKGYDGAEINYHLVDLGSPEALHATVKEIGDMFGRQEQAAAIVKEYEDFKKDMQDMAEGKEHPRVLILMGLPGAYVAASESCNAGSLVKLAGGINVYGTEGTEGFIQASPEDMLEKDPDIILRTAHAMPEMCMAMFAQEFSENDIWKHFDAVKEGKVYDLDFAKFGMSSNFLYKEALEDLKPILYGE